jgi:predicted nucleotidyltransferase
MRTKVPIRPIGNILYADRDGYLPPIDCSRELPRDWRPAVNAAVEAYRSCLSDRLHSVYVRGSIARGTAVPGVSDVDIVALAVDGAPDGATARLDDFAAELLRRYPIASAFELAVVPLDKFLTTFRFQSLRFAISLSGYPLVGTDVRIRLARPRLGPEAITHAHQVSQWRRAVERRLAAESADADVRLTCRWAMKRILRSAFELIMLEINGYTRDLYPCVRAAVREYPDRAHALWTALDLAVNPSSDKALIADILAGLSGWLEQEAKRRFGVGRVLSPGCGVRADDVYLSDTAGTAAGR